MRLKAKAPSVLTTTGWVDEAKGITHVPIEEGMKLPERHVAPCVMGAAFAFAIVSSVVKVLEATRINVRVGSSGRSVSVICAPSTFETKCGRKSGRSSRCCCWLRS